MVFEHCRSEAEAWATFHEVARACHPAQGGRREDMEALCGLARQALGPAWPADWVDDIPNMFDVYCRATGKPNPFGPAGIAAASTEGWPPPDLPAYDPAPHFAWLPRGPGRVRLLYSGTQGR